MKIPCPLLLLLAVLLGGGAARADPAADIQPPQQRDATVALAQKLLESKTGAPLPATIPDPFKIPAPPGTDQPGPDNPTPEVTAPVVPVPPPEPLDRQLLEAIAPMITPSGTAVFGGRSLLLFGQKKLKVGDTLPIIYKDKPYELTITAIDDGTFTLRLRAEEITRTIKPVPTNPSQP